MSLLADLMDLGQHTLQLLPAVPGNTQTQLLARSATLSKSDRGTIGAEGMQIRLPVYFPVRSAHN